MFTPPMRSLVGVSFATLTIYALGGCSKPSSGTVGESVTSTSTDAYAGTYTISAAANPGGAGSYTGKVTIGKASGYATLDWTIPGAPPYAGVAIAFGSKLGVGWGMGGNYGVVVYKISGGTLSGQWTAKGLSGVGEEDLTGPSTLDGTFTIGGKTRSPDGKSYTGTVSIKPTGKTFSITWATSVGNFAGVGIQDGDTLVTGWGAGGRGAGVVIYTTNGTSLDGVWANPGATALGTETLSK
jgi:hypothetical protein